MVGSWGRYIVLAVFIGALIAYGGALAWARPAIIAAAGLAAFVVAFGIGPHCRPVSLWWVGALFAPPTALAVIQLSTLVGIHPWVIPDAAIFSAHPVFSLDPDATLRFLCWTTAVAAMATATAVAFRGQRHQQLVEAMVAIAGLHALFALVMVVSGLGLPAIAADGRTRGTFIYTNHAAAFWAACLPLAMVLAAHVHRRWLIVVALLVLALVLSASRGGILTAVVVSAPCAWFLLPRRRRVWWAFGGSLALVSYLLVIGIDVTSKRFEDLVVTDQGVNLSGRVELISHGISLAKDNSSFGSGAGSTETVFWRNGSTSFDALLVDHLHSDPIEWWLEFGWVGVLCALIGGGCAWYGLRDQRRIAGELPPEDRTRTWMRIGAALGLLDMLLHCTADFIFHKEALALLAALLLGSLAASMQSTYLGRPRSSWRPRLVLCLMGGLATVAAIQLFPVERQLLLAKNTRTALEFRREHPDMPMRPVIEQALAEAEPTSHALLTARLKVRNDLGLSDAISNDSAVRDLGRLSARVPGQPRAWAERLRGHLAGRSLPGPDVSASAERLLAHAPGWPYGRWVMVTAAQMIAPEPERVRLATGVLAIGAPLLDSLWPSLGASMGPQALAQWLEHQGNPKQIRSALKWLRGNAQQATWHAAWVRSVPTWDVSAAQAVLRITDTRIDSLHLHGVSLPRDANGRQAMAVDFARADLPLPPGLSAALQADGPPWSLWATPPNLFTAEDRARVLPVIGQYLDVPWVRTIVAEADHAASAAAGRSAGIGPQSDPRLIRLAESAASGPEADRLRLSLQSRRDPQWQSGAGGNWVWTWWFAQSGAALPLPVGGWVGMWVDGTWHGWVADAVEFTQLPAGVHHIVLVTPD